MQQIAMYPGSFDPFTNGHLDIIQRGLSIFDEILVVVAENKTKKHSFFSVEERVALIGEVFVNNPKVRVDSCSGLIMEHAKKHNIYLLLRGLRATKDFEHEFDMASMNKNLNVKIETLFMATGKEYFFLSSSLLKEMVSLGGNPKDYVPINVANSMLKKHNEKER